MKPEKKSNSRKKLKRKTYAEIEKDLFMDSVDIPVKVKEVLGVMPRRIKDVREAFQNRILVINSFEDTEMMEARSSLESQPVQLTNQRDSLLNVVQTTVINVDEFNGFLSQLGRDDLRYNHSIAETAFEITEDSHLSTYRSSIFDLFDREESEANKNVKGLWGIESAEDMASLYNAGPVVDVSGSHEGVAKEMVDDFATAANDLDYAASFKAKILKHKRISTAILCWSHYIHLLFN
jgi:hypothetical protein